MQSKPDGEYKFIFNYHLTCGADIDKMLVQSQNKFPPANVGDHVLINIRGVDRERLAPCNI